MHPMSASAAHEVMCLNVARQESKDAIVSCEFISCYRPVINVIVFINHYQLFELRDLENGFL